MNFPFLHVFSFSPCIFFSILSIVFCYIYFSYSGWWCGHFNLIDVFWICFACLLYFPFLCLFICLFSVNCVHNRFSSISMRGIDTWFLILENLTIYLLAWFTYYFNLHVVKIKFLVLLVIIYTSLFNGCRLV